MAAPVLCMIAQVTANRLLLAAGQRAHCKTLTNVFERLHDRFVAASSTELFRLLLEAFVLVRSLVQHLDGFLADVVHPLWHFLLCRVKTEGE